MTLCVLLDTLSKPENCESHTLRGARAGARGELLAPLAPSSRNLPLFLLNCAIDAFDPIGTSNKERAFQEDDFGRALPAMLESAEFEVIHFQAEPHRANKQTRRVKIIASGRTVSPMLLAQAQASLEDGIASLMEALQALKAFACTTTNRDSFLQEMVRAVMSTTAALRIRLNVAHHGNSKAAVDCRHHIYSYSDREMFRCIEYVATVD